MVQAKTVPPVEDFRAETQSDRVLLILKHMIYHTWPELQESASSVAWPLEIYRRTSSGRWSDIQRTLSHSARATVKAIYMPSTQKSF